MAAEAVELEPNSVVVAPQELFPRYVAHPSRDGGGFDDVRDEERRYDALTGVSGSPEAAHAGEFDRDDRLVADDPGVVTGWHVEHVARPSEAVCTFVGLKLNVAREDEALVVEDAGGRTSDGLHVLGPAPPRLEHGSRDVHAADDDFLHHEAGKLLKGVGLGEALDLQTAHR